MRVTWRRGSDLEEGDAGGWICKALADLRTKRLGPTNVITNIRAFATAAQFLPLNSAKRSAIAGERVAGGTRAAAPVVEQRTFWRQADAVDVQQMDSSVREPVLCCMIPPGGAGALLHDPPWRHNSNSAHPRTGQGGSRCAGRGATVPAEEPRRCTPATTISSTEGGAGTCPAASAGGAHQGGWRRQHAPRLTHGRQQRQGAQHQHASAHAWRQRLPRGAERLAAGVVWCAVVWRPAHISADTLPSCHEHRHPTQPKWPPNHSSAAFEAVAFKKSLILSPPEIYAEMAHHGAWVCRVGGQERCPCSHGTCWCVARLRRPPVPPPPPPLDCRHHAPAHRRREGQVSLD